MQTAEQLAVTEIEFNTETPSNVPAVAPPAGLAPEAATIFSIIERAARDPSVDIDKMERLIGMRERVQERGAKLEFDNAMADAQAEMDPVRKNASNPSTRSKYASYDALDNAVRGTYTKHGFSLSFNTAEGGPVDHIRLTCRASHRSGHRENYQLDMPSDGKGAKGGDVMTKTHAAGSAVTYGKRYLLCMIFNIAMTDDDGNRAGGYRGGAPGTAGGGTDFRPERRGTEQFSNAKDFAADAVAEGLATDTRSQYQVDKVKKAIANDWRVTNTTPKGQEDQVFAYLNLARNPDDASKISGNNADLIAGAPWKEEFADELDKLLRYFESQSAPSLQ